MTPTPEPAVGQVWMIWDDVPFGIAAIETDGVHTLAYSLEAKEDAMVAIVSSGAISDFKRNATYLGTLDELRELPALKRDAANLEAENAKLRAALKSMVEIADSSLLLSHPLRPLVKSAQALLTPTSHE